MIFHPLFRSTGAVGASGGGSPPIPPPPAGWVFPYYGGPPTVATGYVFVAVDTGQDATDKKHRRGRH